MKKIFFYLSIVLGLNAFAQTDSLDITKNISGVWADSSSAAFTNCTAVFAVDGDSVFVTHYIEFNGQPFVEYGSGTINGNQITYTVKVVVQIPGWSTEGVHTLELSEDGMTLRGTYEDNNNSSGLMIFKRIYPALPDNGTTVD